MSASLSLAMSKRRSRYVERVVAVCLFCPSWGSPNMYASLFRMAAPALVGLCSLAVGTGASGFQFPQPQPQKFDISGKITGLRPGLLGRYEQG